MSVVAVKNARMELKTSEELKELLLKAATLCGLDLTAFVLGPAVDRANQVLREHSVIQLSESAQAKFVKVLKNPKPPTRAMQKLMAMPDFPARR